MAVPDEVLSRVGEAKNLDGLSDDDLKAVLKEYYDRCVQWGQKIVKKSQNFVLTNILLLEGYALGSESIGWVTF